MHYLKAAKLQQGDTIGLVSPSWGGAANLPHRVELAKRQIEALGFKLKFAKHSLNSLNDFVSDTAKNRVSDIHDMFIDDEVSVILAAIGGNHACHLLPLLDYDLIAKHPKIFMGFSDTTVLNVALHVKTGLQTFNGPALLTDFAEYPQMFAYTQDYFLKTTMSSKPLGTIEPASVWTEEFLDWDKKEDLERARHMQASKGWTWLKSGVAEGRLMGGCLESLEHLRGTPYWPDWQNTIFFFETSEEKPTPDTVDAFLMDYENMGVLKQLSGMIVGRSMGYTDEEKQQLNDLILERTTAYDFPIITGMDFGHTAPQFVLPLGCLARIDSAKQRFELPEPAVR